MGMGPTERSEVMATGLNKVFLIGNVGQDPKFKEFDDGNGILKFSLATNERWKNRDGEYEDHPEWHNIVIKGKRATGLKNIIKKGMQLHIEGSIRTRKWEDEAKGTQYMTEIHTFDIKLLGSRRDGEGSKDGAPPHTDQDAEGYSGAGDFDDDVPF